MCIIYIYIIYKYFGNICIYVWEYMYIIKVLRYNIALGNLPRYLSFLVLVLLADHI